MGMDLFVRRKRRNKMIEVKLSVSQYNRLYKEKKEDDNWGCSLVFCELNNNKIQFKTSQNYNDRNIDYMLAEIDLNTPEGEILSKCSGCNFVIYENDNFDSEYFIRALFLERECFWCDREENCSKKNNIDKLLKKIVFVDPISYRTIDNLYVLEMLKGNMEDMLKKDIFRYNDNKLMAINETMEILHSQLQNLVDEWDYNKEDSANG